jgi:hypothetical protein
MSLKIELSALANGIYTLSADGNNGQKKKAVPCMETIMLGKNIFKKIMQITIADQCSG